MLRVVDDRTAHEDAAPEPVVDLDELCRLAAREMIAVALEAERRAYLEAHADVVDATGRRMVVGNGQAREIPPRRAGSRCRLRGCTTVAASSTASPR